MADGPGGSPEFHTPAVEKLSFGDAPAAQGGPRNAVEPVRNFVSGFSPVPEFM